MEGAITRFCRPLRIGPLPPPASSAHTMAIYQLKWVYKLSLTAGARKGSCGWKRTFLSMGAVVRRNAVRVSGTLKNWGCQKLKEIVLGLEGTAGLGKEDEGVFPERRGHEGEAVECL